MRVISKQLSGLGNQLFQYAAGCYFADRYKGELLVIQEPVEGTISHGKFSRPSLISHFQITAPIRLRNRFDTQMLAQLPRWTGLNATYKRLRHIVVQHEREQQRHRFIEDLQLPVNARILYLAGYWQVHQYADAVAPQLRKELQLRQSAQGNNRRLLDRIDAAPISISLHVRRGDYTLAAQGNIALPLDYYRRAIDFMRRRWADPLFFVFSDDIAFARENLPPAIRTVFVEGNDDFSSYEDLRLMAACQHHIIANSSFSWWGAWLNPNPAKVVVAPRHWHLSPESVYPDLLPEAWHAIDSLRHGSEEQPCSG